MLKEARSRRKRDGFGSTPATLDYPFFGGGRLEYRLQSGRKSSGSKYPTEVGTLNARPNILATRREANAISCAALAGLAHFFLDLRNDSAYYAA